MLNKKFRNSYYFSIFKRYQKNKCENRPPYSYKLDRWKNTVNQMYIFITQRNLKQFCLANILEKQVVTGSKVL